MPKYYAVAVIDLQYNDSRPTINSIGFYTEPNPTTRIEPNKTQFLLAGPFDDQEALFKAVESWPLVMKNTLDDRSRTDLNMWRFSDSKVRHVAVMNLFASPANNSTELPSTAAEVSGNKIRSIKAVRTMTGASLKDSKDFVDQLINELVDYGLVPNSWDTVGRTDKSLGDVIREKLGNKKGLAR